MKWIARIAVLLTIGTVAPPAGAAQSGFGEGSAKTFVDRVNNANSGEYQRVLAEFDAHMAQFPADAIAAVERCKFIDEFVALETGSIETVSEDSEKCEEGLRTGTNTQAPAVKLYLWSLGPWDTAIADGEKLLKESYSWTVLQQAELHEDLSNRYELTDDSLRAGQHAVRAVELDSNSSLRLKAAEYFVRIGAKARAVSTIEGMPRKHWTPWTLQSAVTMLLNLGETSVARKLVELNADVDLPAAIRIKLAGSMIEAGEQEAGYGLAQKLLSTPKPAETYGYQRERELFAFQLKYGSAAAAVRAYRELRDKGFDADAFARHRLALTMTHWTAPWRLTDLTGIAALVTVMACVCLLPLVVIVPIHHRSAVKQLKGFVVATETPEFPWSLKHAWYALSVALLVGVMTTYYFSYSDFESGFGYLFGVPGMFAPLSDDRVLGQSLFWSAVLSAVLLLPLLRQSKASAFLRGHWSMRQSMASGASMAIALMMIAGAFRLIFGMAGSQEGIGLGTDTVRSLQGVYSVYGFLGLFGCGALLVPFIEEFVFRGVLLRSAARHIHFWVSAVVQSLIFVALHEDSQAYPFLFAFAMAGSWLALRSGGLLAPIAMHMANNAFAMLAILGSTQSGK